MKKKIDLLKIKKTLFAEGYCELDEIYSKKFCESLVFELEKEKIKIKKNKYFKDEATKKGQIIIRDIILRNPIKFLNLIDQKTITKVLDYIFDEEYILDNCMASNSINVNKKYNRIVHIDSHIPITDPKHSLDIVALICLNDFKKDNGSTIVWPRSHLSGIKIQLEKKKYINKRKSKTINVKKGSVVFFLGQTWHKIGENLNGKDRWGILLHYKRWWIKPATNFTKCGNRIFKMLNTKQKKILGFNSISPEFNFRTQTRKLKTLRKISSLSKKYNKALSY